MPRAGQRRWLHVRRFSDRLCGQERRYETFGLCIECVDLQGQPKVSCRIKLEIAGFALAQAGGSLQTAEYDELA